MDTTITYTAGQVADLLNTSVSTVRRWAPLFRNRLSEQANPPAGGHRRFSEADVAVLRQVQELVQTGTPIEDVAQRLDSLASEPEPGRERELVALEAIAAALTKLADLDARIARLEGEVARLRDDPIAGSQNTQTSNPNATAA